MWTQRAYRLSSERTIPNRIIVTKIERQIFGWIYDVLRFVWHKFSSRPRGFRIYKVGVVLRDWLTKNKKIENVKKKRKQSEKSRVQWQRKKNNTYTNWMQEEFSFGGGLLEINGLPRLLLSFGFVLVAGLTAKPFNLGRQRSALKEKKNRLKYANWSEKNIKRGCCFALIRIVLHTRAHRQ